jgi:hypothetical protein
MRAFQARRSRRRADAEGHANGRCVGPSHVLCRQRRLAGPRRQQFLRCLSPGLLLVVTTSASLSAAEPPTAPLPVPLAPPPLRSAASDVTSAPAAARAVGQLEIQGRGVEKLILLPRGTPRPFDASKQITLQRPGTSVSLPAGEYEVFRVELTGGLRCDSPEYVVNAETGAWSKTGGIVIEPGKPCSLTIGAPLQPRLWVNQFGRLLIFRYYLLDAAGRPYLCDKSHAPAQFAVSCGGRKLDAGSFDYG